MGRRESLRKRLGTLTALIAAALLTQVALAAAQPWLEISAPRAILVDLTTNSTLFERNADEFTAPASLAKSTWNATDRVRARSDQLERSQARRLSARANSGRTAVASISRSASAA